MHVLSGLGKALPSVFLFVAIPSMVMVELWKNGDTADHQFSVQL